MENKSIFLIRGNFWNFFQFISLPKKYNKRFRNIIWRDDLIKVLTKCSNNCSYLSYK